MRTLPPSYVADFDSASACLRATARVLKGKDFPSWGLARPLKRIVPLANLFRPEVRETDLRRRRHDGGNFAPFHRQG
jgi:hypothetical protein